MVLNIVTELYTKKTGYCILYIVQQHCKKHVVFEHNAMVSLKMV
jgi:hypothetical protein